MLPYTTNDDKEPLVIAKKFSFMPSITKPKLFETGPTYQFLTLGSVNKLKNEGILSPQVPHAPPADPMHQLAAAHPTHALHFITYHVNPRPPHPHISVTGLAIYPLALTINHTLLTLIVNLSLWIWSMLLLTFLLELIFSRHVFPS